MARVEWTRLLGDDVEAVVSMLLCLEHPDATRVRPGRGDKGIDVLVPLPEGGVDVYQVKRHAENLTASQRAKLGKSHERLRTADFAKTLDIRRWYPTMPLDPTTTDLTWMFALVKDQPWEARWKGLAFIEALHGKYPMVVDYYLHDGRARADDAISKVTDLLKHSMGVAEGGPLRPVDAVTTLHSLFTVLADNDPFYVYGVSVDPSPPDLTVPGALPPRTVLARQYELPGPSWATIKVVARCAESAVERPVTLNLMFSPGDDVALRSRFDDFWKYGTPFVAPSGTMTGDADFPGGLGGKFTDGVVSISQASDAGESVEMRMQALSPDGAVVAECRVHRTERSQGPAGTGLRAVFEADGSVFTWESRTDLAAGKGRGEFKAGTLTGIAPAVALGPLRLLSALRHPNTLRVSLPYGPASAGVTFPIADDGEGFDVADHVALVEALVDIQEHSSTRLLVPDLSAVTLKLLRELQKAAALLRGETLRSAWKTPGTLTFEPGTAPELVPGGLMVVRTHTPLLVAFGGHELDLGWVRTFLVAARPATDAVTRFDDRDELVLEPTERSQIVMHWVPDPDAPDAPGSPDVADSQS